MASASGTVSAVVAKAKISVRGTDARNSLSFASRSKLRRPTNGVFVSRENSMRNRLMPNTARIGGTTIRPTSSATGRNERSAKRRSLSRSMRLVTLPVADPTDLAHDATSLGSLP